MAFERGDLGFELLQVDRQRLSGSQVKGLTGVGSGTGTFTLVIPGARSLPA
jgi:hypothetical protein